MKQLYTRWGRKLDPDHVWEEYPRPLMRRSSYCSLNGRWSCCFSDTPDLPAAYEEQILVPFSPESLLSGVGRQLKPGEYLWYERVLPEFYSGKGRLLLHFGAVDEHCLVYIDGTKVGGHAGGYLPFTLDITEQVRGKKAPRLTVRVMDDSDTSYHARGKQKLKRGGMYYTAQSGIWQSVWMEEVPEDFIGELSVKPMADTGQVRVCVAADGDHPVRISIYPAGLYEDISPDAPSLILPKEAPLLTAEGRTNTELTLDLPEVKMWNGTTPYLYPYTVTMGEDQVESYFALRTFTIEPDGRGIPRICLNHVRQFERGVLDQGYWSDGLYTAPSDEAFLFDITSMKELGYNMIRKHGKVEPERWYYHCDRLGIVVWQDIVNGGSSYKDWYVTYLGTAFSYLGVKPGDRTHHLLSRTDPAGRREYAHEMVSTIRHLSGHPCIAAWTLFNEGWGQFQTRAMTRLAKKTDPTRLIDSASGWFDEQCGDVNSIHNYFFPMTLKPEEKRAAVISEFGGYTYTIPEHSTGDDLYGYGDYANLTALQGAYEEREVEVNRLIPKGLCASVYTQVSDIEDETNGIFTYDREVQKLKLSSVI